MPSHIAVRTLLRQRLALLLMTVALPAAAILPLLPALPASASSTPTLLGQQSWYTLDRHQLWDKADLAVNVASGDLILHEKDLGIPGIGANNLILERYYNSLSNGAGGGADFGSDWVMSAGGDVKLTIVPGVSVTYQGPSSFQQVFTANGTAWITPPGMNADLVGPTSSYYTIRYHDNGQVLTFNGAGQLSTNADRNGNAIAYAYNTDGTLHQITDATLRTISFNYSNGNVSSMVDNSLGRTYRYTINGSHNLTGYADPANPSQTAIFGYDTTGKHELIDITDPAGNGHTHLVYDTNHRVKELDFTKNTSGGVFKRIYAYNSGNTGSRCDGTTQLPTLAGNTVVTDDNSHNTDYCWDSSGRVLEQIDGDGNKTYTTWSSDNKPASVTDPNGTGHTTTYQYADPNDPNPNLENLTLVTQPTGATTRYTYGASSNHFAPTQVTEPNGNIFTYTYDVNGNPSTMTNGMSSANKVTYAYLLNGNLYGTLDAVGDSNPSCGVPGSPDTQCFNYDANGALSTAYNPQPQTTDTYVNDAASRVSTHTDGKGQVTTYTYDPDDRVKQIAYGSANPPIPCTPSPTCTLFTYDADGNLTQMQDQVGTSSFTQDPLNRPLTETKSGSSQTSYTFDGPGNLKTLTNGAGTITYVYDAADRLLSLQVGSQAATTFDYDPAGNRRHTIYPNNVTQTMTYDASERLTSVSSTYLPTTQLTNWSYTYPNPASQDTNLRYTAAQSVSPPSNWSNSYNPMDNLSQSQGNSYAYNGAAELCGSTCGGPGQSMAYYPSTALGNWNSLSYGYDPNGNMTGILNGTTRAVTMSYNAQNQLSSECNGSSCPGSGSTTTYAYRGVGQADRASATGYDGTQNWTSDLLGVSTETNTLTTTGCTCYYIHDTSGNLVEEIVTTGTTAGTYYPIVDGEGSAVALTNSSGTVKDTFTYSPLGVTTPGSTNSVYEPWQFQGEYADNSQAGEYQGLAYQYHNGARYYEAGQMNGHWTQPDSLNSPFDTHGWNGYNYAGGDSVNLSDPNGMWFCGLSVTCYVAQAVSHLINRSGQDPATVGRQAYDLVTNIVCGGNAVGAGNAIIGALCQLHTVVPVLTSGARCAAGNNQACGDFSRRTTFCTAGTCLH